MFQIKEWLGVEKKKKRLKIFILLFAGNYDTYYTYSNSRCMSHAVSILNGKSPIIRILSDL